MYKLLSIFILSYSLLEAKEIKAVAIFEVSGIVSDFVKDGDFLYVATDSGIVDIINLLSKKIENKIYLEDIHTRIHSIDRFQGKTLLVTSAKNAYRNVWIHDDVKGLKKIIDQEKKLMPKRAFFSEKGEIILATFGSDIVLYESVENYNVYNTRISESTMGGMVLSQDKKKMIIADESGTVRLIDVESSKVEETFTSEHVDNIYSVAYNKGILLTGGQDRRIGIYPQNALAYHIKSDFLVYCVGLSPDGKIGIYSSGFEHNLQLFRTQNGTKTDTLIGHYATPNKIMFVTNNTLISTGDENKIFFWVLE